jgi:hypothetical protein
MCTYEVFHLCEEFTYVIVIIVVIIIIIIIIIIIVVVLYQKLFCVQYLPFKYKLFFC